MDLSSKRIGIWGFGVVGKSIAKFLLSQDLKFEIMEKRNFTDSEISWLKENNINYFNESNLDLFLQNNDLIMPSPGIDLTLYSKFNYKFVSELDLFVSYFKKPIIAITGTLGKTSVTHLLTKLLCLQGIKAIAAGNIGLGMCDLISSQDSIDLVVLEVSSFQLEQSNLIKPIISVWTNFYSNHLDRHLTMQSYFDAKFKIMSKQTIEDNALVPLILKNDLYKKEIQCRLNFFSVDPVLKELNLRQGDSLFFIEDDIIYKYYNGTKEFIYNLNSLPEITFTENWLIIFATLNLFNIDLKFDINLLDIPEHRLEKFVTKNHIDFYNDSKSTVSESTLAAVSKFKNKDVILFLGGLSKGVDRSILINNLKDKVKTIICFGAEAEQLKKFCDFNSIQSFQCSNLNEAVELCFSIVKSNEVVLFSPAGSSYDLFSNYQQRGTVFKQLINNLL